MAVSVRYIVNNVGESIPFYEGLGFEVKVHPGPGFVMLSRDDLRLLLNTPEGGGGAGQAMPDGSLPQPGGWNRFQVEVEDLESTVAQLGAAGVTFRSQVIEGQGGKQIVADDPSGNPVELFQAGPRSR